MRKLKLYVIGDLRHRRKLEAVAGYLMRGERFVVDVIWTERKRLPELLVAGRFSMIEACDAVVAVKAGRRQYDAMTLCLMEYARRIGKKVVMTDGDDVRLVRDHLLLYVPEERRAADAAS